MCRTKAEFVVQALAAPRAFDSASALPDFMLDVLAFVLMKGPLQVMRRRLQILQKWRAWADTDKDAEAALHASLEPALRKVLKSKNLSLFRGVCRDVEWPDESIVDEMQNGFMLVAKAPIMGVFWTWATNHLLLRKRS